MATFRVVKTDAEWKRTLPPFTYQVLRKAGTERPFTSPLNNEHRTGIFRCAGCASCTVRSCASASKPWRRSAACH